MPTKQHRIHTVELKLTPTEGVIQWMLQINELDDQPRDSYKKEWERRSQLLFEQVRESTRTAMQGEASEIVDAAVSKAAREAAFLLLLYAHVSDALRAEVWFVSQYFSLVEQSLYQLFDEVHVAITNSLSLKDLEVPLSLDPETRERVRSAAFSRAIERLTGWRWAAVTVIAEVFLLKGIRDEVSRAYFEGHAVLPKATDDQLSALIERVESLVTLHDKLAGTLFGPDAREKILSRAQARKLERWTKPRVIHRITHFVNDARLWLS